MGTQEITILPALVYVPEINDSYQVVKEDIYITPSQYKAAVPHSYFTQKLK